MSERLEPPGAGSRLGSVPMLADERRRAILEILAREGRVVLPELCKRLAISEATARRDATALAEAGFALRSHGGLLPTDHLRREPHFRARSVRGAPAKQRIAARVAALFPHEGGVFIDAGSTCLEVARLLVGREGLRIYSNSLPVLALAAEARATLTAIGGEVRGVSLALVGGLAQTWLARLRFDACLLGASAATGDGAHTTELHEAAVKAEVLRRSTTRFLAMHAEKWDRRVAVCYAPWSAFSTLVTDRRPEGAARAVLAEAGVRVVVA